MPGLANHASNASVAKGLVQEWACDWANQSQDLAQDESFCYCGFWCHLCTREDLLREKPEGERRTEGREAGGYSLRAPSSKQA